MCCRDHVCVILCAAEIMYVSSYVLQRSRVILCAAQVCVTWVASCTRRSPTPLSARSSTGPALRARDAPFPANACLPSLRPPLGVCACERACARVCVYGVCVCARACARACLCECVQVVVVVYVCARVSDEPLASTACLPALLPFPEKFVGVRGGCRIGICGGRGQARVALARRPAPSL